jgi:SnoaL-like domain
MNDMERMLAEHACERIIRCYCRHADLGEHAKAAEQFLADGRLEMPNGQRFEGKAAIRDRLASQPATQISRHLIANVVVEVRDADHASATSYLLMYRGVAEGPAVGQALPLGDAFLLGQYEDEFVKTGEGWKFASRRLRASFKKS